MTNIEIIESLCGIVEAQNKLIRNLATRLYELEALTEGEKGMIDMLSEEYSKTIS